jgi:hypothetical protein
VRGAPLALLAVATAAAGAGCALRLSDPVYAFKDIHADEPSRDGQSLVFGTIVVDQTGTGDLNSVDFLRIGPGAERKHFGANRVNLFRVFSRRCMKDGTFVMEVGPGLYELQGFTTSGWGQPMTWTAKEDARKHMRVLITRPGIYDLGTIKVGRGEHYGTYDMERVDDADPQRQTVLTRAIAGTKWQELLASASTASADSSDASDR